MILDEAVEYRDVTTFTSKDTGQVGISFHGVPSAPFLEIAKQYPVRGCEPFVYVTITLAPNIEVSFFKKPASKEVKENGAEKEEINLKVQEARTTKDTKQKINYALQAGAGQTDARKAH